MTPAAISPRTPGTWKRSKTSPSTFAATKMANSSRRRSCGLCPMVECRIWKSRNGCNQLRLVSTDGMQRPDENIQGAGEMKEGRHLGECDTRSRRHGIHLEFGGS